MVTRILFDPRRDLTDGTTTSSPVTVEATPTNTRADGSVAILPTTLTFTINTSADLIQLAPPAASWAWRLVAKQDGQVKQQRTVRFPDTASITWQALTDVDPSSLQQTVGTAQQWDATFFQIMALLTALPSQTTITAQINAAVQTLVGGASTALDTLGEIQAALGNDPNLAATLTTSIAAKATALTAVTKTANATANPFELVAVDATNGPVTITLPTAPADKTRVTVKKTDMGTNLVLIARGGTADLFNRPGGPTSLNLTVPSQANTVQYVAATGLWIAVADDFPLSQLDLRFITPAATDAKIAAQAASDAAASVTLWKPNTAYGQGQSVLNPAGFVVTAIAGFTSGSSYDPTKWSDANSVAYATKDQSIIDALTLGG